MNAPESRDDDQHGIAEDMAVEHLPLGKALGRAVITYCLRISSRNEFLVRKAVVAKAESAIAINGSTRCQK